MTGARAHPKGPRAAVLVGTVTAAVVGIDLIRWIRPQLLFDPDPSWAPYRLLLGLGVVCGATLAGGVAAAIFSLWGRAEIARAPLEPLPLRRATLIGLAVAAILVGTGLRFASLAGIPASLWIDDLSLIRPSLSLRGEPSDFADAVRSSPYGVPKPYGSIGVLYLEGYRTVLRLFGTTVFGVRFPSALAGAASLVTAALLGRALLPAGGGSLAALVLAGMRWHLILSRWAWNMIVLAPIVDLSTLVLVAARRRRKPVLALAAGLIAGVGAHVYLSAWVAAAALALFAFWPTEALERTGVRLARSAAFVAGVLLTAAPLLLLREGRTTPYFARARDHNVFLEIRRTGSVMPPVAAAADAVAAPWLLADPTARHDLPGRLRLGWLLGIPLAIALGRALLRPRDAISALLLSHTLALLAGVVMGGQADNPNGSRFGYLSTSTAVAVAAGVLWLVGIVSPAHRRAAAVAAIGALAVAGALGARDALLRWPEHPATFRSFYGQDTLIGRAAARWERLGRVTVASDVGSSAETIDVVRRYRLDPNASRLATPAAARHLRLRIVAPSAPRAPGERVVERVRDAWNREWALVLASRNGGYG